MARFGLALLGLALLGLALAAGAAMGAHTFKYPPPGDASRQAADTVVKILSDIGVGGSKARTVGVAVSQDGRTVIVALSGSSDEVRKVSERIQKSGQLPEGYVLAPAQADQTGIEPVVATRKGPNGSIEIYQRGSDTCAEPRLFQKAREMGIDIGEMSVVTRNPGENPWPLQGGRSQDMRPCDSCSHNEQRIVRGPTEPIAARSAPPSDKPPDETPPAPDKPRNGPGDEDSAGRGPENLPRDQKPDGTSGQERALPANRDSTEPANREPSDTAVREPTNEGRSAEAGRPGETPGGRIGGLGVIAGVAVVHELFRSWATGQSTDWRRWGAGFAASTAGFIATESGISSRAVQAAGVRALQVALRVLPGKIPLPGPLRIVGKPLLQALGATLAGVVGHIAGEGGQAAVEAMGARHGSAGFGDIFMHELRNTDWVDVIGSSLFSGVGMVVGALIPIPGGAILGALAGDLAWSLFYGAYHNYGWKGLGTVVLCGVIGSVLMPIPGVGFWIGAAGGRLLSWALWGRSQAGAVGPPGVGPPGVGPPRDGQGSGVGAVTTGDASVPQVPPRAPAVPTTRSPGGAKAPRPTVSPSTLQGTIVNPYLIQP